MAVRGGPGAGHLRDRPLGADYPAVSRCTRSRNTASSGQALESLTATVRVFRVTTAPIFKSRSQMVRHCARAKAVPPSAVRRIVSSRV